MLSSIFLVGSHLLFCDWLVEPCVSQSKDTENSSFLFHSSFRPFSWSRFVFVSASFQPLHSVRMLDSPQLCDSAGPPMSGGPFMERVSSVLRGFCLPNALICHLSALKAREAITGLAGGGVGNQSESANSGAH